MEVLRAHTALERSQMWPQAEGGDHAQRFGANLPSYEHALARIKRHCLGSMARRLEAGSLPETSLAGPERAHTIALYRNSHEINESPRHGPPAGGRRRGLVLHVVLARAPGISRTDVQLWNLARPGREVI